MKQQFYSHGKLLISGEYLVLDGAWALAVPTQKGQWLNVTLEDENAGLKGVHWKSLNHNKEEWFTVSFNHKFEVIKTSDESVAETLQKWLQTTAKLNPDWLQKGGNVMVETVLEFPNDWGLGSSSTMLNNLALWGEVNPYELLEKGFSGSGYDIGCANASKAILFQVSGTQPKVKPIEWKPSFQDELFFVHLGKKQRSSREIVRYREKQFDRENKVQNLNQLTEEVLEIQTLAAFEQWIEKHETLMAEILEVDPVKVDFPDYPGALKSLGAWGGDFILATRKEALDYFLAKGLTTILPFREMVL
tara:strand:- start:6161 stop:7072 length:912 start_codon:yes stop_codon:yes gene_type:complete